MTCMQDITRSVLPPRAAFLDFPPGHTTGAPFAAEQQHGIVQEALALLETVAESGTIMPLPFAWPYGEDWKQNPLPPRLPRYDTPQFQTEADRLAATGHIDCPVCVVGESVP